ncbi:endonuclease MutS2 [Clostridium polyendosporum]|uniref:Endonuclease MutS2 n=1 Tax=Clostridium polyendosporum TaxID=69208 RepID=A0A919VFR3_9CLOT|nr:endonuclease MutS2 [Clostridium polyendosporum]GIM28695.1 endonuclease MutS2 [Clostridium polyendosporum]
MNEKSLKVLEFNKIKEELKKYTLTAASKEVIEELTPYKTVYEVKEHLQETKEAYNILIKKGNPPFEGLYDVREAVKRVEKGGGLNAGQLLRVAQMVRCARRFNEFIQRKEQEEEYRIIEDVCSGLTPLRKIEDAVFTAIVGEDEVSDKASQTLYNIRRSLKEKNSSVRDKVNSIIRENSKYLQDNLFTMRGDRYVIPVKSEYKGAVQGLIHDQSSTGATLFIEPISLVNLNNEIKELMLKEKAEIERILSELSSIIYDNISAVKNNSNILIELDFIFAKAKYCSKINGVCPKVNDNGAFTLLEARHPLIDPQKVVPSDIYLGKDFTSLVVTGPNTGGKTVTLKTVGLLHLMAMSGLLIPTRENSSISFFDEIFADIGDEQSIEQSLSTFSSHMTNIVGIMEKANNKSLALFDELGAGTDPTEGAALAMAILETLRQIGCKIVATTHYSELKGYALKTPGVENASVEFDVETLRPTYRLLIGIPGKSNAFEISKRLGLQEVIIEKAKGLISHESLKFEDLIQNLQEKTIRAEKDARDAEKLKFEINKLKEKYEEKLTNIEKTRENAYAEARRESKQILRDAKEEADQILKNMRELERMGISSDARRMLEEERSKLKNKLDKAEQQLNKTIKEKNGEELKEVKLGMEVFLPSINQKVVILTMPDSKGEVQVEAGIMKVNVKVKDLRVAKETKEVKKKSKKEVQLNLRTVSSSIDLRGMDAEEACYTVDKYLDEAYLGGLGEVTVVHGKGTGVLRKAINDMLKSHPHVKSFRLGEYGEGGTGVTVVQLK